MRRRIIIVLLSLGVVGGYGSGLLHVIHHHKMACACGHHGPHADPEP